MASPISHGSCTEDVSATQLSRDTSSWTSEAVSCWLENLGEKGIVNFSLAKELSAAAAKMNVDGAVLCKFDSEAWATLGVTNAVQRAACCAAFEEAGQPLRGRNIVALNDEIQLGCKIHVLSLSNIDCLSQTFRCKFILIGRTLNAAPLRTVTGEAISSSNWEPRIYLRNILETSEWGMEVEDLEGGEIQFKWQIAGTFGEIMELQSFPFDCQRLQLEVSSKIPARFLKFCNWENRTDSVWAFERRNFMQSNVFDLGGTVATEAAVTDVSESTTATVRPVFRFALTVRRKPMYFFWNVMLPMSFIEGLSHGSFAVPRTDVADRLSVSLTMVLTAVAFKQIIAAELPNVSYLTLLDKYVIASFACTCLVAFENILVGPWQEDDMDELDDIDKLLSIVCPSLFVLRLLVQIPQSWAHAQQSQKEAGHIDFKCGSSPSNIRQTVPHEKGEPNLLTKPSMLRCAADEDKGKRETPI